MILSALIFYSYRQTKRERKMSEALLLNILPADTASELKANGTTTARAYTNVTILFADIIGFSLVAEKLDATALISELDTYFREFDHIMQENGLEKIKTVGDAYLAVAGLPNDNKATAADVMRAAIAMQAYVHKMKKSRIKENRPYFELRIGLHTGSVVAGVVGFKKFQFDIWGDAVNIAARMEQSSAAGKINVSEDTYEQLKNEFKFIHRGKILAKNKGELSMYFYVVDEYEVADA
jgi:class 3 adenylate cyclase